MTKRLSYSRRSLADLRQVWDYTLRQWGLEQADQYVDAIRKQCEGLARGEVIGSPYHSRRAEFRKVRSGSHLIYVAELGEALLVTRILHVGRIRISSWA